MKLFTVTLSFLLLLGCNSTPDVVMPKQPALEANEPNSGVLYQISSGGYVISEQLYKKYTTYLKKYAKELNKTNDKNRGVTKCYIITDEVMLDLLKMHTYESNTWLLNKPTQ